jgi:hypothetical protein
MGSARLTPVAIGTAGLRVQVPGRVGLLGGLVGDAEVLLGFDRGYEGSEFTHLSEEAPATACFGRHL